MSQTRRTLVLASMLVTLGMAGCAHRWERPAEPDGTWCHVFGKRRTAACTRDPVPAAAVEEGVKRFAADPAALTLIVVRRSWADVSRVLPLAVDGQANLETVPASIVSLRLRPGRHELVASCGGTPIQHTVDGPAGAVVFAEFAVSAWAWGTTCRWLPGGEDSRSAALRAKLIADIDQR